MSKTLEELGYEKEDIISNISGEKIGTRFWETRTYNLIDFYDEEKTIKKSFGKITMEELKAIYKYCEDNKWI
jgi:hypothetical protein